MEKLFLNSIRRGEKLRLRDDFLPNAKVRDWLFHKMEGEKILLEHKTRGYVWEANMNNIDWDAYEKRKKAA